MIRLLAIMFMTLASITFFKNDGHRVFAADQVPQEPHTVPTFIETLEANAEAWEQSIIPAVVIADDGEIQTGNCMPHSVAIRDFIRDSGRNAVIIVIETDPFSQIGHAMVLFDYDKDGQLDSFIDNGTYTDWKVHPRHFLDDNTFGTYYGQVCDDSTIIADRGACTTITEEEAAATFTNP